MTASTPCPSSNSTNSPPLRRRRNRVYLITQVELATRCIIAYAVAYDREPTRLQALLNSAPSAHQYSSDQLAAYTNLVYYPGQHEALPNMKRSPIRARRTRWRATTPPSATTSRGWGTAHAVPRAPSRRCGMR